MAMSTDQPINLFIIGCGNRGSVYSRYALERPDMCKVVGIAEPRAAIRTRMIETYGLDSSLVFDDWQTAHAALTAAQNQGQTQKPAIDAVVICLQDSMHLKACLAFANAGFNILLEKPMALTREDCEQIVEAVNRNKVMFAVCHVLRYTEYTRAVKEIIDAGTIGDIVNIQHTEPVGWYHYAHSYVRGNWRNSKTSCFMLMTKSCHDLDWLCYVNNQSKPLYVQSFGSQMHANAANKPKDAAERCLDCPASVERNCPFSAKQIYLDPLVAGKPNHFTNAIIQDGSLPDIENVTDSLRSGPYGFCVYAQDKTQNDVVDNQTVSIQFENGSTCTFTMIAYSKDLCQRKTRIYGTRGEIEVLDTTVRHFDFATRKETVHDYGSAANNEELSKTRLTGHGFADYYLMKAFCQAIRKKDSSLLLSSAEETLQSHLLVFAAEEARLKRTIVNFPEWCQQ